MLLTAALIIWASCICGGTGSGSPLVRHRRFAFTSQSFRVYHDQRLGYGQQLYPHFPRPYIGSGPAYDYYNYPVYPHLQYAPHSFGAPHVGYLPPHHVRNLPPHHVGNLPPHPYFPAGLAGRSDLYFREIPRDTGKPYLQYPEKHQEHPVIAHRYPFRNRGGNSARRPTDYGPPKPLPAVHCRYDEEFRKCGCERKCGADQSAECANCKPGCFCKFGLSRKVDGDCVSTKDCTESCGRRQRYAPCGGECEVTCTSRPSERCQCSPGCVCIAGYIRTEPGGDCVEKCPGAGPSSRSDAP